MKWLEVALTVNGEMAEAVADVLVRFAPDGVTTEQAVRYNGPVDEGSPIGPVTVRAYLADDENLDDKRQKLEEALFYLGMIRPLSKPRYTPIPDQDWMEAWKKGYKPIPIGKRLMIVPAWMEIPNKERVAIKIDPGMAFGTGTHPTTQLCLEFIEEYFPERTRKLNKEIEWRDETLHTVIDIGCGSGILSIGALKLGAGRALGVDIDEAAIRASRENGRVNGIPDEDLVLGSGSVVEILAGKYPIRMASLVLANILAPVLVRLFNDGLARLLIPGGRIILSGVLEGQAQTVIEAAEANGLMTLGKKQSDDWVALACGRM